MKIAIVNCFFTPRIGGAEKYCHLIAANLTKSNEVSLLTSEDASFDQAKKPITLLQKEKFQTFFIPYRQLGKFKFPKRKPAIQLLKKLKPDAILINGPLPYSTIFGLYAKSLKIPVVLTYQGDANPSNFLMKTAVRLERQLYRFIFDRIINTTEKYKKRVSKFYPAKRISVVPLAIENHYFQKHDKEKSRKELHLDPQKKYILFVAKLDKNHYYKGIETFISSAKLLPELEFLVIGDGEDLPILKTKTTTEKNIHFLGRVEAQDLVKYYSAADIFVLPSSSSSEGFGLVLLEAAACGTPVITTAVVGSSEFIRENQMGLIIPPLNPVALKNAIEKMLNNSDIYKDLQKHCLQAVKELTWLSSAKKTFEVLHKIIKK